MSILHIRSWLDTIMKKHAQYKSLSTFLFLPLFAQWFAWSRLIISIAVEVRTFMASEVWCSRLDNHSRFGLSFQLKAEDHVKDLKLLSNCSKGTYRLLEEKKQTRKGLEVDNYCEILQLLKYFGFFYLVKMLGCNFAMLLWAFKWRFTYYCECLIVLHLFLIRSTWLVL